MACFICMKYNFMPIAILLVSLIDLLRVYQVWNSWLQENEKLHDNTWTSITSHTISNYAISSFSHHIGCTHTNVTLKQVSDSAASAPRSISPTFIQKMRRKEWLTMMLLRGVPDYNIIRSKWQFVIIWKWHTQMKNTYLQVQCEINPSIEIILMVSIKNEVY